MVAIETRYHGPTNYRGSRITATANGHRVTVSYPYELSGVECHRKAAEALCEKMGWKGRMVAGGTDKGYVFVFPEHYIE